MIKDDHLVWKYPINVISLLFGPSQNDIILMGYFHTTLLHVGEAPKASIKFYAWTIKVHVNYNHVNWFLPKANVRFTLKVLGWTNHIPKRNVATMPVNSYTMCICHNYIIFTED